MAGAVRGHPLELPFDKALARLVTSLQKLGTGILAPYQMKRIARAKADAKRIEVLSEIRLGNDIEQIARGEVVVDESGALVPVAELTRNDGESALDVVRLAQDRETRLAVRRLLNLRQTALLARSEVEAKDTPLPPPSDSDREVDQDWLERWEEAAERASTKEAQQLWARVLAGESRAPGTFSQRTLSFLKDLDKDSGQLIERMAVFVFPGRKGATLARLDTFYDARGLSIVDRLELEHLGVIIGASTIVGTLGWYVESNSRIESTEEYFGAFTYQDRQLIQIVTSGPSKPQISTYGITPLGREVMHLITPEFDPSLAAALATEFKKHNKDKVVRASVADWKPELGVTSNWRQV